MSWLLDEKLKEVHLELPEIWGRVLELWQQGKNQYEIAEIVYGSIKSQGRVSRILRSIAKKIGLTGGFFTNRYHLRHYKLTYEDKK